MTSSKLSLLKVWILLPALVAGLWSLSSCQKQKKPSFLIIAVDRLSFNSFACGEDKQNLNSGLSLLCREAIRFTHAYTTSTQSAAAVGSLLTGLYPAQHKLHRSFDRLQPGTKMVQEVADQAGYQTYFFSGSPTILKKTGLSQGFDIFEDSAFFEKKTYFLDFKYQTEKFLASVQESSDPFFTVIYNSELEALNEGESQISSLEKLDEKFFKFFSDLKDRKMWEDNYVIVVGLQGKSDYSRYDETPFSNLNSENTRVNLFIKPPRAKGDEGIFWKMDSTVNLADLGASIWASVTDTKPTITNSIDAEYPIVDFSSIWKTQNKNFVVPIRKVLIEAPDTWNKEISLRLAVLYKNLLHVEDEKPYVYNILTDGLESINIASQQKDFVTDNNADMAALRQQLGFNKWTNYKSKFQNWVFLNREYWSRPNARKSLLDTEFESIKKEKMTQPLSVFLARSLIQARRTSDLNLIKEIDLKQKNITERTKAISFENVKQQSVNLALENIWGLWEADKTWLQSNVILENQ
ncbi:MAG: sulfatase-like hydrolase/transferase [Bdellovibrio sp.]|nr:sulfatase-like hydrolase/transferase [Bdellovibrio sp.]